MDAVMVSVTADVSFSCSYDWKTKDAVEKAVMSPPLTVSPNDS